MICWPPGLGWGGGKNGLIKMNMNRGLAMCDVVSQQLQPFKVLIYIIFSLKMKYVVSLLGLVEDLAMESKHRSSHALLTN